MCMIYLTENFKNAYKRSARLNHFVYVYKCDTPDEKLPSFMK